MDAINFIIKSRPGKLTNLDKAYAKVIKNIQLNLTEETRQRWEVYNSIIEELLNNKRENRFTEIKYRITDGENPNDVILDVINKDEISGYLWVLNKKLEEYKQEDLIKRFL
jgi:N12 class adenine-specific DNA methylase